MQRPGFPSMAPKNSIIPTARDPCCSTSCCPRRVFGGAAHAPLDPRRRLVGGITVAGVQELMVPALAANDFVSRCL